MKKEKKFNYDSKSPKHKEYSAPDEFRYMFRYSSYDGDEPKICPKQLALYKYNGMRQFKHAKARIIIRDYLNEFMKNNFNQYDEYYKIIYTECRYYEHIMDKEELHEFFVELQKNFNEGAVREFKKVTGLEE